MRYVAIRSEGNLIPYDVLDKIGTEALAGQKPADFGLPKGRHLVDEISRVWADAQNLWSNFKRRRQSLTARDPYGTSITRTWIVSLLSDPEMLGFELKPLSNAVIVNNVSFAVSHRNGEGEDAAPVHIEGCKIDLDRRLNTKLRTSPQAMLQDFLNNAEQALWGIVTNGLTVRLLRDSSRTSRPTYVEFDLESIFEGNRFNEFALFYRLLHRTRFPETDKEAVDCLLEKYYQDSIEQGLRIRDKLRDGVEEALKTLGTAFLQHPSNESLRAKYSANALTAENYHRQLLLLVYRLLFLMVAEERKLIIAQGENSENNQKTYDEWYSINRLRDRASRIVEQTQFGDLWAGLKQTFTLFEYGSDRNALGISPLNGDLFDETRAIPDLAAMDLYNHELLLALRRLSLFKASHSYQRVNYSDLDVEELGSVYESLLDFKPVIATDEKGFSFDLRLGMERKSTGSYYTRPELVHELIESALVPVLKNRLAEAEQATASQDLVRERKSKEQAILALSVCDPACGSGHFLLAAARKLGKALAQVRTGEDEPRPSDFHLAVRDVISNCIYGVDLNPLAVDLCKLALWLEGHWIGKPLSFLDHRIKCGNSLIGVLDIEALKIGIPDGAFNAVTGDDIKVSKQFKKANREEREGQPSLPFDVTASGQHYAIEYHRLTAMAEETAAKVRDKARAYESWRGTNDWWHDWTSCNLLTSAFFQPLTKFDDPFVPTHERLLKFVDRRDSQPQLAAQANSAAEHLRFFHWQLEFPEVFDKGGFDVLLGNPPWEKIQVEELSFFAGRKPEIAKARGVKRKKLIALLQQGDPLLYAQFAAHRRAIESVDKYIKESRRFPLTGLGKMNTYANFSELSYRLIRPQGRAGLLVPLGIATDDNNKDFFCEVVKNSRLASLFGFENEEFIFPAVHHAFKFVALTITGSHFEGAAQFAFLCRKVSDIHDRKRRFTLRNADIRMLNPNTATAPIFRTALDAVLNLRIYGTYGVMINEQLRRNDWSVELHRMFNPTDDSALFSTLADLQDKGCSLAGNIFDCDSRKYLPIYEAKMLHQWDHRFGTYQGQTEAQSNQGKLPELSEEEHSDGALLPLPRHWVDQEVAEDTISTHTARSWLFAYRRISSAVVLRTAIGAVIPRTAAVDPCRLIYFASDLPATLIGCFIGCFNAITFDYFVRQKVGGNDVSTFMLKQFPILPPSVFSAADILFILPRAAELIYTAWDVKPFADDLWRAADSKLRSAIHICKEQQQVASNQEIAPKWLLAAPDGIPFGPFKWRDSRREALIAELDGYYAHLYRLTRNELRYILDPKEVFGQDFPGETFRVLKEWEERHLGEYRSRRLILTAFDELADTDRFRNEMASRKSAFEIPASETAAVAH